MLKWLQQQQLRMQLIKEKYMPRFSKRLNNISRMQSLFRAERLNSLNPSYHTYILAICRMPGVTQDALAKDICVNKSTVTRRLDWLESEGYVLRKSDECDKRCTLVYPTEKMKAILPEIKKIAGEWMRTLTDGISDEEIAVFESVLCRMESRGKAAVFGEVEE